MVATRVPETIAALLAFGRSVFSDEVEVVDGDSLDENAAQFVVGVISEDGSPSFDVDQEPVEGPSMARMETISVVCALLSPPLGDGLADQRQYVADRLNELDVELRAAREMDAYLGQRMSWTQSDSTTGDQVRCDFVITVSHFI